VEGRESGLAFNERTLSGEDGICPECLQEDGPKRKGLILFRTLSDTNCAVTAKRQTGFSPFHSAYSSSEQISTSTAEALTRRHKHSRFISALFRMTALPPIEAAKRLAAYAAVDRHVKPEHKVIGIWTWAEFRVVTCSRIGGGVAHSSALRADP
jgi:hypothetical protein